MYNYKDSYYSNEYERYDKARVKGVKKQANKILENLMLYFDGLDADSKKAICHEFCILRFEKGQIDGFQFFLSTRIIKYLEDSCLQNQMPHLRWYYQMTGESEYIMKAYNHPECDERTIKYLCECYFDPLWHGSHHFPDHCLIEKEESRALLNRVQSFIQKHASVLNKEAEEYYHYEQLYSDWWTYESENTKCSFEEWCKKHNREYEWLTIVYYNT